MLSTRKIASGLAACAMAVIATQSPAGAGTSTPYIRTVAPQAGAGGGKFYHSGDELVVCDARADGWGAIGFVTVWNPSTSTYVYWYSVKDPSSDVSCRTNVDHYFPAALDYNGGPSRNIPEGRRVRISITVYRNGRSCADCTVTASGVA